MRNVIKYFTAFLAVLFLIGTLTMAHYAYVTHEMVYVLFGLLFGGYTYILALVMLAGSKWGEKI